MVKGPFSLDGGRGKGRGRECVDLAPIKSSKYSVEDTDYEFM